MSDGPDDDLQNRQDDLLEQLGLHPAQLAIQRRLLGAAQGDSSGVTHDPSADAGTATDSMPAPAGTDAAVKTMPRPGENKATLEDTLLSGNDAPPAARPAALKRPSMFSDAENNISKKHHFWGGVLKGLDVAGSIVSPGAMTAIPGSMLNQRASDTRANNTTMLQSELRQKNALASQEESKATSLRHPLPRPPKVLMDNGVPYAIQRGEEEFVIGGKDMPPELKAMADAAVAAHKQRISEQQDKPDTAQEDKKRRRDLESQLNAGTLGDEDRAELLTRQQEEKMQGVSAEALAQAGKPPVPAQFPKGEADPGYKKASTAWGRSVEGIKAREAAAPAEARGKAYGSFKPVQVIDPGTGELRWTYARDAISSGASPAGEGTKAMTKHAQFEEMHVAADNARSAIEKLDKPFNAAQIAKLTLAMGHDDPGIMHEEIKTLVGTQQLTPAQEDFVVWISQLNERAMSLRNVAGMGQGAQDLRSAIRATLPSATSGSKEMALKQLDAFKNQMELLEKGVPGVKKGKGGSAAQEKSTPHSVNKNPNSDIGFTPSQQ